MPKFKVQCRQGDNKDGNEVTEQKVSQSQKGSKVQKCKESCAPLRYD